MCECMQACGWTMNMWTIIICWHCDTICHTSTVDRASRRFAARARHGQRSLSERRRRRRLHARPVGAHRTVQTSASDPTRQAAASWRVREGPADGSGLDRRVALTQAAQPTQHRSRQPRPGWRRLAAVAAAIPRPAQPRVVVRHPSHPSPRRGPPGSASSSRSAPQPPAQSSHTRHQRRQMQTSSGG